MDNETKQDTAATQTGNEKRTRRARRGQRGSILRRPGSDSYTVVYRTPAGKQKWEGGFATKGDAQKRLNVVLGSIQDDRYVEVKNIVFREFCDKWMSEKQPTLKPKTWASYKSALKNWITPKFGDWPMCDITRAAVKSFGNELLAKNELSVKFIKNVLVLLYAIFEDAVDSDCIAANPARSSLKDLPSVAASEVVVPTPEEVVRTMEHLPATYQVLMATAAVTGVRRAELLGLQWDDVDWLNSSIRVRRTLQRITKALLTTGKFRNVQRIGDTCLAIVTPKSENALRTVEMSSKIAALLASLRSREQESSPTSPFIFQTDLGLPIDPDAVYDVLHGAQDAADVRRFGLHGLRHLYSSLLASNCPDVKFTQQKLGHASAQTTFDIYTHVVTKRGHEYAAAVEAAFPFVSNLLAERSESSQAQDPVN